MFQNSSECESLGTIAPFTSSCGTLTWVAENDTCNPTLYLGSACREPLLEWQDCIVGQNSSKIILINAVEFQSQLDYQMLDVIEAISK